MRGGKGEGASVCVCVCGGGGGGFSGAKIAPEMEGRFMCCGLMHMCIWLVAH